MSTPIPRHRRRAGSRASHLMCAARKLQPRTIALRRALHRHPEQGLQLPETQAAVLLALADLPVQVHTGRAISSVVGVIEGARPGPTVLLRADMDALPVTEESGVPMPDPLMGAEDFSYVLARVPGAMAFLGACPPGQEPDTAPANHSNRAVFDETAMAHGVALYAGFALEVLTS